MTPHFRLQQIADGVIQSGSHTDHGHVSAYEFITAMCMNELYLPARDKRLALALSAYADSLLHDLTILDSSFDGLHFIQKCAKIFKDRLVSGQVITQGQHGSITLVANDWPMYLTGAYDTQTNSAHLVWATEDVSSAIRATSPGRYLIYRFPIIDRQVIFIPSMPIVSAWYSWMKKGPMLAFNALELKLFKANGKL